MAKADKSLEQWIWDAACSIRGAKEAAKYKDYILPLIFVKRLCDVFDDEINRLAAKYGSRAKAFELVYSDHEQVRFYLPLKPEDPDKPVWSVIRELSDDIGQALTGKLKSIAGLNPRLNGIIDRVDFNATTHGQRELDDDIRGFEGQLSTDGGGGILTETTLRIGVLSFSGGRKLVHKGLEPGMQEHGQRITAVLEARGAQGLL